MAEQPSPPRCAQCSELMKLIRVMPAIGPLPDMFMYKCMACGLIKTIEQTETPSEPPAS